MATTCTTHNPCCCNLRCGIVCIGIYSIIIYILLMIGTTLIWTGIIKDRHGKEPSLGELIFEIVVCSVGLLIAIILIIGAALKIAGLVKAAFLGFLAMFVLGLIALIVKLALREEMTVLEIVIIGVSLVIIVVTNLYVLYVIYAYIRYLTRSGNE